MRVGIVGGGPAGLYLALLLKRRNPSYVIRVVEQNPADATFGFGVVFSDRALSFLKTADPESYRDIERRLQTWDNQAIVHRDQEVRIDGLGFSGIARLELLQILQAQWSYRNVVLIGDALRSVHFSVGSGTRMALQDSITLAQALAATDDVEAALRTFEEVRRPQVHEFLQRAAESFRWYEGFRDKLGLDPVPFTYDYVMRSGRISYARLKQRSPRLAADYERYLAQLHQPRVQSH